MSLIEIKDLGALQLYAKQFIADNPNGNIVGLQGELGSGKTTLVRSIIEILCQQEGKSAPRVVSPSYVIHQSYRFLSQVVEHFDLYRLTEVETTELIQLGYFDALENAKSKGGFVFVEWPEKTKPLDLLQLQTLLRIEFKNEGRTIKNTVF